MAGIDEKLPSKFLEKEKVNFVIFHKTATFITFVLKSQFVLLHNHIFQPQ